MLLDLGVPAVSAPPPLAATPAGRTLLLPVALLPAAPVDAVVPLVLFVPVVVVSMLPLLPAAGLMLLVLPVPAADPTPVDVPLMRPAAAPETPMPVSEREAPEAGASRSLHAALLRVPESKLPS